MYMKYTCKIHFRPVETGRKGGGGGAGGGSPQIFANLYFDELKKIVLNWKTVQNHETSRNFSKFIDFITLLSVINFKSFTHYNTTQDITHAI